MEEYIKGNYRKSIFKSDKGYIIGLFRVKEASENLKEYLNKTITFTGTFASLNTDDVYCLKGNLIDHPKYGHQFQVSEYSRIKPDDVDGLVAFFASDLFKGVGTVLAKKMVATLGKDIINVILDDVDNLLKVPLLGSKKARTIYETLKKHEESHQVLVYLTELGFNMKEALDIYNIYKSNTIMKIEHNIYNLFLEANISFIKIDEIASNLKIEPNDERRIKACIIYIMKELIYKRSDTYLELEDIYDNVYRYLQVSLDNVDFKQLLSELVNEGSICIIDQRYYLKEMFEAENNTVMSIIKLINGKTKYKGLDEGIKALETVNNITYNDKQKKAIKSSLENNITIITGGPGTGKTTIIKAICELYIDINNLEFEEADKKIALLAPTGRASKRMSEATLLPASTIHRFLKWNKETDQFAVNEYEKDNHHLIIIDEVSMIDIILLSNLFKGLTDNIKLVLVGDYHQLPSVGPGQVLKDLIESDMIDTIVLEHLYRQDENSYINTLAHEINSNELSENFLETKSDYTFLKCENEAIKDTLKNLCYKLIAKGYDYKRVQIMAPIYAGINGIDNLNMELQQVFNPKDNTKKEIKYGDVIFRENDKVLQLVNMPDDNVYNGDIGIIKNIITVDSKLHIYIDYDGNIVKYEYKDLNKIRHGFIISIHKSQGSEFEMVIIPISSNYKRMLYRKLIYTGITRAKKKLILIGQPEAFIYSVNNNSEIDRKTYLLDQLVNNLME
ncbi:MAG: ATP-dependent RecD-like DNA helicase [Bacilli bacterium]